MKESGEKELGKQTCWVLTNVCSISLSASRGHSDCWKVVCSSLMGHTNFLSYLLFNCCPSKEKPWGMPERLTSPACIKCWLQRASPKCVPTGLVEPVVGMVKTRFGWLSVCRFLSRFEAMPLVRAGHSALNSFFFLKTQSGKFAWVALHNSSSSNVLLLQRQMQIHLPGGWVALCSKTLAGSDETTAFRVAWIALYCTTFPDILTWTFNPLKAI